MKISRLKLGQRLSRISWFFIGLFLLIALFFLPFSKSVAEIGVLVALALWALRKWPWDEAFPRIKYGGVSYAVFLLITAVSFVNVPPNLAATGLQGILKWLKHITLFFMLYEFAQSPRRLKILVWLFLISMGLVCLNALYQLAAGADLVKNYSIDTPGRLIRLKSSLGSPNSLACFLLLALPAAFYVWSEQKSWSPQSVFTVALLALFFTVFLSTLSRSAFLALAAALIAYGLFRPKTKLLGWVLVCLPLLLGSSRLFTANFITSLNPADITIGERLRFWKITWQMIQHSPWLGNGVNMYYQKFSGFAPASEAYRGYAHNCYLQLWSEIGIFGLVAFLWPLAAILGKNAIRGKTSGEFSLKNAIGIGLAAYLVQSFFDTNLYSLQVAMLFWVFWGVYAGLSLRSPSKLQRRRGEGGA